MGVKFSVSEVKAEIIQMNAGLAGVRENAGKLVKPFQQFCDETALTGKAYESHKDYIQDMQLPTVEGIQTFCADMMDANNHYMGVINEYFADDMYVDEDTWRMEYEILMSEYNRLNSTINWVLEMISNLAGGPYSSGIRGEADRIAHEQARTNMQQLHNSLSDELACLKGTIEWYRINIENIGQMLMGMAGVYSGVDGMFSLLQGAVAQLGRVSVGAGGVYAAAALNRESFRNLKNYKKISEVSQRIESELGDELLSAEEFDQASEEEKLAYINKVAGIMERFFPSLSAELGETSVEIPIGVNMSIYTGIAIAADAGGNSSIGVDVAVDKNAEIMGSWSVVVGDNTLTFGQSNQTDSFIEYTHTINDITSVYMSTIVETESSKAEWGVITNALERNGESVTVTTNCGLRTRISGSDWEVLEEVFESYRLDRASDPLLNAEDLGILEVLAPILLPEGALVPFPVF